MEPLTSPIKSWWQKVKVSALSFLRGRQRNIVEQEDIDKRLVYSLSTRKVPSREQLKHLKKFLNPREYFIVKACVLVVVAGLAYYGLIFARDHVASVPAHGGAYSEGLIGYPKLINPLYSPARDVDADISRLIFSSLYQYDESGRLTPDLAESLSVSEDQREYTIKIRDGVVWHNGERLTADDVVFTISTIQNAAFHSPLRSQLAIAAAEKVDDLTIKLTLNEPFSPFQDMLTFGIMPKRLWESVNSDGALLSDLNLKPVGSGPFRFKSLVRSSAGDIKEYSLEANPDYYGDKPFLGMLTFKFYPNYEEAVKALNSKQVSGISHLPFGWQGELLAQNSLHFFELSQPRLVSIFFNQLKNTALANKDTRIALAAAINKEELVSSVFGGAYPVIDGPILPDSWAFSDTIARYGFDPSLARERLSLGPLSITLTVVDSGSNSAVAEAIKNYWEAAGAKVNLRIINSDQAAEVLKNRDFEAIIYGQSVGGDPDLYAFWHSSQTGSAGLNLSNYSNSDADKLLSEARSTTNRDARREKYQKFQDIVTADIPAIFLYAPTYTYVQGNKLQGFSSSAIIHPADRFAGVTGWYLKTDKRLSW